MANWAPENVGPWQIGPWKMKGFTTTLKNKTFDIFIFQKAHILKFRKTVHIASYCFMRYLGEIPTLSGHRLFVVLLAAQCTVLQCENS